MDENELKQQQKQAEQDEASQKTAHVAGKAAATYFGGGLGAKAYDLASKTKVGQDIEKVAGKALQKQPGMNKAMEGLNKSGALDAADKGMDLASGSGSSLEGLSNIPADNSSAGSSPTSGLSNSVSNLGQDNTEKFETSSDNSFNAFGSLFGGSNNQKKMIITGVIVVIVAILSLVVAVAITYAPGYIASDFVKGVWDNIVDFFTTDHQELEDEFYDELKKVQQDINKKDHVCIDVNLITASLTVNRSFDKIIEDGTVGDPSGESFSITNGDGSVDKKTIKKMIKQIRLLANMQIKRKRYGWDTRGKYINGKYCHEYAGNNELVEKETEGFYQEDGFPFFRANGLDSTSMEEIAKHDASSFQAFFTKKSEEEKNYEYYFYQPIIVREYELNPLTGKKELKEKCPYSLPDEVAELSIGDYENNTESVFYWNLVNSFIPEYYDEYLPSNEPDRTEAIVDLANDIYLLYDSMGPNQTCEASYYAGPSSLCPGGVTIDGNHGGTYDLEEYVAGVIGAEMYDDFPLESKKALAVAARTYVLMYTDYCTKTIGNSSSVQNFTRNYSSSDMEAALATAGEILLDSSGNIYLSEYDSWNCKGSTTCTYTSQPDGVTHTISISDQYLGLAAGGHGRGMSQIAAADMASKGANYKDILNFFYQGATLDIVLSPSNTDGASIASGLISDQLAKNNSSVEDMNQYIYDQVIKSGVSTRDGVVAAANSLISGYYNQTGYKLAYELGGKYSGYGMDTSWGGNTGNSNYSIKGLDCSGFISWAVHNGGYDYEVKNAKGWGNSGTKRSWSKGTTDSSAAPGDLIYNEPPSGGNGTSGHIRMIIDVNDDGYVVAEASSKKNGVRITNVSFKSTGSYYLVDMSDYYSSANKVTDYPM